MRKAAIWIPLLFASLCGAASAQEPPKAATVAEQLAMLESPDPKLARNKQHVFDFWRIVYEGGHVDQAPKYMAESYLQHNPNVKSGRAAFVALMRSRKPKPIAAHMKMPVISIMAERDLVMVNHVRKVRDRARPDHIYHITWFDVFRIDANGMIAEHWDPSEMWVGGKAPGQEFFVEWDK